MKLSDKNASRFGVPDWAGAAVLFLTFAFCINFMNRAVLGPFLVHMRADLGLDPAEAASLLSFMSIGMGCGMLCSGAFASLLAPRRLISLSLAMAGAALFLISRANGLGEARVYFLILGITSGFYLPSAMATLATLVRPESWSRAVAVHELAPCLSFIVAPVLAETAAALWGWRHGTLLMGCISVAVGLVFLRMRGGTKRLPRPSLAGAVAAFRKPVFWIITWLFGLSVGAEFAPYSVLPLSLTLEQGLDSAEAARLLSLSRFPAPFLVLFGGYAVAWWGAKRCLLLFMIVEGAALACLSLPHSMTGTVVLGGAMAVQAMAAAFVFPALFTLFAESFPQEQLPMIISLAIPLGSFIGGAMTPYLLGLSGKYLSFASGYLIFGIICLATVPFFLLYSRAGKRGSKTVVL